MIPRRLRGLPRGRVLSLGLALFAAVAAATALLLRARRRRT